MLCIDWGIGHLSVGSVIAVQVSALVRIMSRPRNRLAIRFNVSSIFQGRSDQMGDESYGLYAASAMAQLVNGINSSVQHSTALKDFCDAYMSTAVSEASMIQADRGGFTLLAKPAQKLEESTFPILLPIAC